MTILGSHIRHEGLQLVEGPPDGFTQLQVLQVGVEALKAWKLDNKEKNG